MGTLDPPAPPPPPPSPPEVVASNHHHDVHNHDDLPPNYHQQQQPPTAETPEEVASEGCLPQAYLTLPFDDVKELIRQDLASLCDKKLNPKDRCRVAHALGNFSATNKGDRIFISVGAHKSLYGIVEEFCGYYMANEKVSRPCIVGFSLLVLNNMIKQELQRSGSCSSDCPTAVFLLGNAGHKGGPKTPRIGSIWLLLKCLCNEVEKQPRLGVPTLAYCIDLLTVLELSNLAKQGPNWSTILTKVKEESLDAAKLQLMRAVSFVMRYSKCKPDLCSMAQTMGLFGLTTKSPHLFARGAVGWRLFTKSGGVTPFAQAMPGLDAEEDEASERLSVLSFLTDLGPDHAQLILPAVGELVKWAGIEDPRFERERDLCMLSLAKLIRGGDSSDVTFLYDLGLFPTAVQRLRDYYGRALSKPSTTWEGQPSEQLCVALEVMFALVALSLPSSSSPPAKLCLEQHRDVVTITAWVLSQLGSAPETTRDRVAPLVTGILLALIEVDTTVIRQMREVTGACTGLRQLLFHVHRSPRALGQVLRLITLSLILEPDPSDFHIYEKGALLPKLEGIIRPFNLLCPTASSKSQKSGGKRGSPEGRDSVEKGFHHFICAMVIREKRLDLGAAQAAYRTGGPQGFSNYLNNVNLQQLLMAEGAMLGAQAAAPPMAPHLSPGGSEGCRHSGKASKCAHCSKVVKCGFCQAIDAKKKCSRCKQMWYCSEKCQRAHWSVHKKTCQAPPAVVMTSSLPAPNPGPT